MPLFEASRHESLTDAPWDESLARAAVERIAADAESAFTPGGLFPIHPLDVSPERANPLKPLYYGAAGAIWALRKLEAAGLAALRRDYLPAVAGLLESHRADSRRIRGHQVLGYPLGDAGILLLHWKLAASESLADELHRVISANRGHPSLGFGWGAPGSMLAALFMWETTLEPRWSALYLELFEELWRTWEWDESLRCRLWLQDLYGVRAKRVSGLHGLPATLSVMLRGRALLGSDRSAELVRRAREALHATATRDGPHANWPLLAEELTRPETPAWLVQHCIGAPGVVNCLASLPSDSETDALLVAAGELTWAAGPVTKLPSLCHGVPGGGYAFLKLYARSGNDEWLARARRFAMHAIGQAERGVAQHGQRKLSLWTGDLGLAVFLADCLAPSDSFPTLDSF
jgi:hypothetical protein